ncbi:hypothetical protein KAR91_52680 [Candidatus Pacearchaeota archaeon]|nr:hypothetical protein [Candidatus Pacearchaeota archaeon]
MNEISGTDVADSVGTDDGTTATAIADTSNQLLGAACRTFDGDDLIHVPFTSNDTEGSVGIFFKMPSMATAQTFFMFSNGVDNTDMLSIRIWLGKLDFFVRSRGVTNIHCDVGAVSINNYHCALFTVDATGNKVYLDGAVQTPTYTTGNASNNEWFDDLTTLSVLDIGAADVGASPITYFTGQLDEFPVWNKAKNAADALEWWNVGAGLELEAPEVTGNPWNYYAQQ